MDLEPEDVWRNVILRAVSTAFRVDAAEVVGPSRKKTVARARACAAMLFRDLCNYSYPEIAKRLHRADHTTAAGAVERARFLMREDRDFARRALEAQKIAIVLQEVEGVDQRRRAVLTQRIEALETFCRWLLEVLRGDRPYDAEVLEEIESRVLLEGSTSGPCGTMEGP